MFKTFEVIETNTLIPYKIGSIDFMGNNLFYTDTKNTIYTAEFAITKDELSIEEVFKKVTCTFP